VTTETYQNSLVQHIRPACWI